MKKLPGEPKLLCLTVWQTGAVARLSI